MKHFIVNFETGRVYPANNPEEFVNLFWSGLTDMAGEIMIRQEIVDYFAERGDAVDFVGSEFSLFTTAKAEISDLEKLGWHFSDEEKGDGCHVLLRKDHDGSTWYAVISDENEGSYDHTGDDEKTLSDIISLSSDGKLWDVSHIVSH